MGPIPDLHLEWLFYLAILGVISAVALVVGGGGWLIWFVINHVRIV